MFYEDCTMKKVVTVIIIVLLMVGCVPKTMDGSYMPALLIENIP